MSAASHKNSLITRLSRWFFLHPIIVGCLLLAGIAFVLALPLFETEAEHHEADPNLTVAAHGNTSVSQSFIASRSWLTWMEFSTGNLEAFPSDTAITFALQSVDSKRVIYQATAPLTQILVDDNAIRFSFSPFLTRKGNRYKATLRLADQNGSSRLPLTYQQADEYYRGGNYWIKDLPKKGDLGFRLGGFRPLWYAALPHIGINEPWWKWVVVVIIGLTVVRIRHQAPPLSHADTTTLSPATKFFSLHLGILLLITLSLGICAYLLGSRAFYDTAHDGLETIEEVLHGNIQPFYEHYTGHQPLMDWILAGLFLVFGVSAATLHAVGIGAYAATVALFVLVARRLWNSTAGWYAGWLAAGSHWLLLVMHEGARLVLIPPLMLGALLSMLNLRDATTWRARVVWATLGGLAVGGLGYVYAVSWIIIIAYALALVTWWAYVHFTTAPPALGSTIALMALVALLTLLPLIQYAYENPHRILERPRATVADPAGQGILHHIVQGAAPMAAAFLYVPVVPWGDNVRLSVAGIPVYFPVPLVAPSVGLLLILAPGLWLGALQRRRPTGVILWLFLFFLFGWLPSLIASGSQPHFRRTIAAVVPLLLIAAWSSKVIHPWILLKSKIWRVAWVVVIVAAILYGPFLYFGYVLPSPWYASFYYLDHDILARRLFPYVEAGYNVALAGNRAHLKSLQFYALASPYGKNAFTLMRVPETYQFSLTDVATVDVIVVNHHECQKMTAPGFSSTPILIDGKLGLAGCIYIRDGNIHPPLETKEDLPHSGSLWKAVLTNMPPFDHYQPFQGPIYNR